MYLACVTLALYALGMIAFVYFAVEAPVTWWADGIVALGCFMLACAHFYLFVKTT